MATLRVDLRARSMNRLIAGLALLNLVFTGGTALFIHMWRQLDHYGPNGRAWINYVLVQFHLATENVVAAWYSSMLLLGVAIAAGLAYALERRQRRRGFDAWVSWGWALFAAAFALLSLDETGSFHERLGMLVKLNRVSLGHAATQAVGWVYVLAIPIGAVALFMLAFAWLRLRRVPLACACVVAGVVLFVCDPLLELGEMWLLQGGGAGAPWAHSVNDALIVIEEGPVELGGALCFLAGILLYIRRTMGSHVFEFTFRSRTAAAIALTAGIVMTGLVPMSHWIVAHLPPADTGIPDDWFPAAILMIAGLLVLAQRGRRALPTAALSVALSAYFGAGIYGYTTWFRYDIVRQLLQALLAVCFTLACARAAFKGGYANAQLLAASVAMTIALEVPGRHTATLATLASTCCLVGSLMVVSRAWQGSKEPDRRLLRPTTINP